MNFWQQLPKPIMALSPMDGVTDAPMRTVTNRYSQPDVTVTEFVHVEGLWKGKMRVYLDLVYSDSGRPVVAQVFGSDPEYFYKAAHIVCELGFNGIDINMGCPASAVVKRGGGASLINDPERAKKIVLMTKKGVADWVEGQTLTELGLDAEKLDYIQQERKGKGLDLTNERKPIPVSVKTRIGFNSVVVDEWVGHLLEVSPAVMTIHGRTLKQLYSGAADWEAIGSVADMIHQAGLLLIGNGDVESMEDGRQRCQDLNLDGVMIGRAALGNPWLFRDDLYEPTPKERLEVALEHARLHVQIKGELSFIAMRKHLGWYCKGFEGAKELRMEMMRCESVRDVERLVATF